MPCLSLNFLFSITFFVSLYHYYLYGSSLFTLSFIAILIFHLKSESKSHSVMSDSLQPCRLYSPQNSPGQSTAVGSLSLLQRIFLTQESNRGLLPCRQILYQLSDQQCRYFFIFFFFLIYNFSFVYIFFLYFISSLIALI